MSDSDLSRSADPMVVAEGLTRRFNGRAVVDGLDFSIAAGEIVGLLGPNGAGKTTTMRMITGYLPPTAGRIQVAGHDVGTDSLGARRALGYMPENMPLYLDMRVREYLEFRAALKGLRSARRRERIDAVLAQCDLIPVRRTPIGNLSKGYRQRIGLADALVAEPPLLILDEPSNGLDPIQIRQTREFIRGLGGRHTVILSSHLLSEVEQTCDRVIILDNGRIRAIDRPVALATGLRTAGSIRLEIQCPDAVAATARLRALEGVRSATLEESLQGNWSVFRIRTDSASDLRVAIVECCRNNNWPLREIHRRHASLEDVFVELTRSPRR